MEILIKPLVTEKLTNLSATLSRYGFIVDRRANKIDIKKAVEEMYGVTVESINTANYHGKKKSRFTKAGLLSGRANHYKKAYVTLARDDTIDFYSNI